MFLNRIFSEILFGLCFLISACEYEPDGRNFLKLTPISEAPPFFAELNFQSDTVIIPTGTSARIFVKTKDSLLIDIKIYIDGKFTLPYSSNLTNFSFSVFENDTGTHQLRIEFTRRSGSGSIADLSGSEGFVYTKTLVMIIAYPDRLTSRIYKIIPEGGSLKLYWNKYRGIDFKGYHIFHGNGQGTIRDTLALIRDINTLSYYDSSFVGYKTEFIMQTETSSTYVFPKSSFYEDTISRIWATTNTDGKFLIKWDRSKYYSNIKSYDIFEDYSAGWTGKNKIGSVIPSADLNFIYENSKFGVPTRFYLNPVPERNAHPVQDFYHLFNALGLSDYRVLGDSISIFMDSEIASTKGDYCFFQIPGNLCRYNTITDVINKFKFNTNYSRIRASSDGQYLLALVSDTFKLMNADNVSILSQVTQKSITGSALDPYNFMYKFGISENGVGVIYNKGLFFYDFLNHKLLHSFTIADFLVDGAFLKISPDGNYILWNLRNTQFNFITRLYSFNNNTLTLLYETPANWADFDPVTKGTFTYFSQNKLTTISLTDESIVSEIDLNANSISSIDFLRREVLCISPDLNNIFIADLTTGTIKKNVPTFNYADFYRTCLKNKVLIGSSGFYGYKLRLNY